MRHCKIFSFVLCLIMIVTSVTVPPAFAADDVPAELSQRKVYLHAFDEQRPVDDTTNHCTVYTDDTVNIYFAVDDPNKARSDGEPQFDMTGYTVKIYFDTKYFSFPENVKNTPIDYSYPNDMEVWDEDDIFADSAADSSGLVADSAASAKPGYFAWKHEESDSTSSRTGYACATVFLLSDGSDNVYSKFPEGKDSDKYWYNLCRLPLVPKQAGYTSVRIDVDTDDEYTLELFAKNNTPDDALNFDCTAVNDGEFFITIDDKNKPKPPRPDDDHPAGTYNDPITIGLQHDNAEKCEIWYSLDGVTDPITQDDLKTFTFEDGDEIDLRSRTVVMARTRRTTDGKWSDVRQYVYDFMPRPPYLFNSAEKIIPNIYSEVWKQGAYMVSAADSTDFSAGISAGSTIYYTFHPSLSADSITDALTGWKKADKGYIPEAITGACVMRLVTVNQWGTSDVALYHLSAKPDVVTASPGSGLDREQPIVLSCDTPGADIYYTTDGKDPRNFGAQYTGALTLEKDTVIKAVARLGEEWGDVSSFWYLFSNTNRSGVSAFNPAGTYVGSVEVTLYPNEPGNKIEISEDGITWLPYDGNTMTIDEYTRFRARIEGDKGQGDEFVYVIKPRPPVFSPESTQFTSSDVVTVFCPDSIDGSDGDYELWYTTDGTEPTEDDKAPSDTINITITDYTTIKAVVVKDGQYKSDTVTHTYGVVYGKPAAPLTTLLPGFYDRTADGGAYMTQFKEVPDGTEIYYTVNTGDECTYPDINNYGEGTGTFKYNDESIEVIDSMIINAVAVRIINGTQVKSENASFHYLITPEPPKAAPSAIVSELGVIPVDAVAVQSDGSERSIVRYTVENDGGSYTGEFCNDYDDPADEAATVRFYIDLSDGRAYRDAACTQPLVKETGVSFTDSVLLRLSEELDGVDSGEVAYIYSLDAENAPLIAPYADKDSGKYDERRSGFEVKLYSVYDADSSSNVKIQWKLSGDDKWSDYNAPSVTFPTTDAIMYIRTVDKDNEDNASACVGYVYYFVPPAPTISPVSGTYAASDKTGVSIAKSADTPDGTYYLYYSQSTEPGWGWVRADSFDSYIIDTTKTVRAYVINDDTKRVSETVYASYVTEADSVLSGAVSIKAPFDKTRINSHLLGSGEYAKGILFNPSTGVLYNYKIDYVPESGVMSYESEDSVIFRENNALIPTELMDKITVTAWLDGDRLATQIPPHTIDIVHLEVPTVKVLGNPNDDGTYDSGTNFRVENVYKDDPTYIVYYTLDGSDPTKNTASRKSFSSSALGPVETLSSTTTVRAVYYSACGDAEECTACAGGNYAACLQYAYGKEGQYTYQVPVKQTVTVGGGGSGGGGGGTRTVDNTRKYTVDIFGDEHPTHIGYINGYPDGSVRPEGDITREEISAILYRIKPMAYDEPIETTGKVFPDVTLDRWSVREIEHLTAYGIIEGYPDGNFVPGGNLTRAEFAALIRRFIESAEIKTANNKVELSDIEDHWAYDDITFIAKAGLIDGYEDGTFRPDREITRAEVMSVINRILGRKPLESYVKSQDFNPFFDLEDDKWYYVTVLEATITHDYYLNAQSYEYKWENWK